MRFVITIFQKETKLKNSLRVIEEKNLHLLPEWQEENPNFKEMDTQENQDFIQISVNSLGGGSEDEVDKQQDKILKNVLKEVAIEKKKLKIEN